MKSAGIWYETISILDQLREEQPEDSNLFSIWETVLTSVGLESLAQASRALIKDLRLIWL